MSGLVVFDIDDTLAHTAQYYDAYFYAALEGVVGPGHVHHNLGSWTHVTDEGIVREVMAAALGEWSTEQRDAIKADYIARMRTNYATQPAVAGASDLLTHLRENTDWKIALATGNWHGPAVIKLESAGIDIADAPLGACDDRPSRTEVMEYALTTSQTHYGQEFKRVVYAGDASWDVRASRDLGWPFVGVTDPKGHLTALGASHVLPDLTDPAAFLRALDDARVPA